MGTSAPTASSVFVPVRLETSAGELVTLGEIPPCQTAPDVLLWGSRVFLSRSRTSTSDGRVLLLYKECFAVTLVRTRPAVRYELVEQEGRVGIRCLTCQTTSFNPSDIDKKYCARCGRFHDDVIPTTEEFPEAGAGEGA